MEKPQNLRGGRWFINTNLIFFCFLADLQPPDWFLFDLYWMSRTACVEGWVISGLFALFGGPFGFILRPWPYRYGLVHARAKKIDLCILRLCAFSAWKLLIRFLPHSGLVVRWCWHPVSLFWSGIILIMPQIRSNRAPGNLIIWIIFLWFEIFEIKTVLRNATSRSSRWARKKKNLIRLGVHGARSRIFSEKNIWSRGQHTSIGQEILYGHGSVFAALLRSMLLHKWISCLGLALWTFYFPFLNWNRNIWSGLDNYCGWVRWRCPPPGWLNSMLFSCTLAIRK